MQIVALQCGADAGGHVVDDLAEDRAEYRIPLHILQYDERVRVFDPSDRFFQRLLVRLVVLPSIRDVGSVGGPIRAGWPQPAGEAHQVVELVEPMMMKPMVEDKRVAIELLREAGVGGLCD